MPTFLNMCVDICVCITGAFVSPGKDLMAARRQEVLLDLLNYDKFVCILIHGHI